MPIVKYTLLVGASLLALILVAGHLMEPSPATAAAKQSASSLELLRKMANHGELRPFASSAAAGPFLAMPLTATLPVAVAEPSTTAKPAVTAADSTPPSALNAQARLAESEIGDKPARPAKKIATRKPKPRVVVVENVQHGPGGFFGALQSW